MKNKRQIVCLCGSTRFKDKFMELAEQFTIVGDIVLMPHIFIHSDPNRIIPDEIKHELDILHKDKIDLADVVYIVNVNGYIGDSTKSEIEYAKSLQKPIYYLEKI